MGGWGCPRAGVQRREDLDGRRESRGRMIRLGFGRRHTQRRKDPEMNSRPMETEAKHNTTNLRRSPLRPNITHDYQRNESKTSLRRATEPYPRCLSTRRTARSLRPPTEPLRKTLPPLALQARPGGSSRCPAASGRGPSLRESGARLPWGLPAGKLGWGWACGAGAARVSHRDPCRGPPEASSQGDPPRLCGSHPLARRISALSKSQGPSRCGKRMRQIPKGRASAAISPLRSLLDGSHSGVTMLTG